jgi:hypothetical protein
LKVTQIKLIEIEPTLELGIGGEQKLESAIKDEAIDVVGSDSTTNAIGGLKELDADTGGTQRARTCQSGEPGPDNHHVFVHALEATNCKSDTSISRRP